jgi:hypothetical protein
MSGRPNTTPAGEQEKGDEGSLVAPIACAERTIDRRGTQTPVARSNGSHPHQPAPALIGLVRLLARQAAREVLEASMRPEHGGGEDE